MSPSASFSIQYWVAECIRKHFGNARDVAGATSGLNAFQSYCLSRMVTDVTAISQPLVDDYKHNLKTGGYAPSTINTRMSQLAALLKFIATATEFRGTRLSRHLENIKISYVARQKNARKWHLTDDDAAKLLDHLQARLDDATRKRDVLACREALLLMNYFEFVLETGLRVEEVLRLVTGDFENLYTDTPRLIVPGTKTIGSRSYVPISKHAAMIIVERIQVLKAMLNDGGKANASPRLFDIPYYTLKRRWAELRTSLGLPSNATLKGLRRTFAARAFRKGLPLHIVQELMRHSSSETTMEYLKLFGMADNPETRALLNRQVGQDSRAAGVAEGRLQPDKDPDQFDINDFVKMLQASFGPNVRVVDMGAMSDKLMGTMGGDTTAWVPYNPLMTADEYRTVTCPDCIDAMKRHGLVKDDG